MNDTTVLYFYYAYAQYEILIFNQPFFLLAILPQLSGDVEPQPEPIIGNHK